MLATELADQLPSMSGDERMSALLPHTRASFKIQDVIPKSHLANFKLSDDEMRLIVPDDQHHGTTDDVTASQQRDQRQRFGMLVRAVDSTTNN